MSSKQLQRLASEAVAGAERTTGQTRALWLALFRLIVGWMDA